MSRPLFRRIALVALAAPLALTLAACGDKGGEAGAPSGDPIAKVAPPAGKAWTDVVAKTPEGGYRMGNPDAPIKVIEFGSLTCSHCADFAHQSAAELGPVFVASGRVSYELRNFVRDPIDITAAQLTRCGPPEAYFALTEQVFAYQPQIFEKAQAAGNPAFEAAAAQSEDKRGVAIAQLTGLTDFFAARGISVDQANACLADGAAARALAEATEKAGKEFDITGTPTFIINGQKVELNTWAELKARLETMGAR
mgnify:FL=1